MLRRWPNFGLLALVAAAGGLLTGVFLALNYAPTLDAARDSVAYIEEQVTLGWLLRGLHHWAGSFAIVLAALHGLRLFWSGAYRKPRQMAWLAGCGIFLVLVGFAYTGYLLAGDERALTGLGVLDGVAGSTPIVGAHASALVRGAPAVSSAMLTRLYVVHLLLLPAALIALAAAFVFALRRAQKTQPSAGRAFGWRRAMARDAGAAVLVCCALALCALVFRPALGPKPDFTGAGAQEARPEWFFLWINELLRIVPGAAFWIGAVLPGLLIGAALALPWISRGRRTIERGVVLFVLGAIGLLTGLSLAQTKAEEEQAEPFEPVPPPTAGATIEERVAPLLRRSCSHCHVIDGDEEGGDTGPPLTRDGFGELYTEKFFRLKVKDPVAFWSETGMQYKPKRRRPSAAEIELLVEFFFGPR